MNLHRSRCIVSMGAVLTALLTASAVSAQQTPSPAPTSEPVYTLDEFVVSTPASDHSVKADESLGAMRTTTRLIDTPIAVTVLKQDLLDNFQLNDLDEQLPYVASFLPGEVEAGGGGGGILRGFTPPSYRNGFRRTGVGEVVNLDRVEVIKGPLSAMFGQSSPGGLVNYVTKRPQSRPSYSLKTIFGSYDYQRSELHATGPVVPNKLFYRVDGSYSDYKGVQQFFYNRTWALSTAFTYVVNKDTSLTLEIEKLNRYMNNGTGGILNRYDSLVSPVSGATVKNVIGGIDVPLSRAGFNLYGPHAHVDREITTVDLHGEHRFNRNVILRADFQGWNRIYKDDRWTTPQYYTQRGLFVGREPYTSRVPEDNRQGQIDLLTSFNLGETSHKLLLMVDGSRAHYKNLNWQMQTADRNKLPTAVRNVDPTSPDDSFFAHDDLTRNTRDQAQDTDMLGFLASERASLASGRLLLFGSVRIDNQKVEYRDVRAPANDASKNTTQTSYSVGGNWHVLGDKIVLFANTSTAFDPQTKIDRGTGELQDNITAAGYEFGVKGDIIDKKVYWMATAYQIDRKDIPQKNPSFIAGEDGEFPPGVSEFIGTGVERSKGMEFEVFGDLTENFSFTLALGLMDCYTKGSSDDPASVGVKLLRIPDMNWGATTRYRFTSGPLKGVSTGVAVRYTDSYVARYGTFGSEITGTGNVTNNLVLNYGPSNRIEEVRPETTLASFFVNYSFSTGKYRHTVGFYVNNLFDEEWWTVTGRVGVGREFRVNYGLHF